MFDTLGFIEASPADAISCEALIAWCERDCESRYSIAASFIRFADQPDPDGPHVWSDQARVILANAPNPQSVLVEIVKRFRPMSWVGLRSAIMEANAQLLDSVTTLVPTDLDSVVIEAKAQFAKEIAQERQREIAKDRARDERFE